MKLAFRNIVRSPRRSFATGFAIVIGYVGVILLGAYIVRAQKSLEAMSVYANLKGHILISSADSLESFSADPERYQLTKPQVEKINSVLKEHQDQIEFSGRFLTGSGLVSNGRRSVPFIGIGFEPEVYLRAYSHPFLKLWAADWVQKASAVRASTLKDGADENFISITHAMGELVGVESLAERHDDGLQLAARNYLGDLNAVNAAVGGFHSTGLALAEDTSLLAPLKTFQDLYSTDGIQYISVFLKNDESLKTLLPILKKEIGSRGVNVDVLSFENKRVSPFYAGTMGFLHVVGAFFIVLICGAVVLSIMNSVTINLLERLRELGTLRALGFRRAFIQKLMMYEISILGLISVGLGIVTAVIVAYVVNSLNIRFTPSGVAGDVQFILAVDPAWCLWAGVAILSLATLTTFFVVRSKNKFEIVNLLQDAGA